MHNQGRYIVIEGLPASGKTTMITMLAEQLAAARLRVHTLHEPDTVSTPTAAALQRLIDDPAYPMTTRAEVLLYNAARSQTLDTIAQQLRKGTICLVDHSFLGSLVTNYYGRGDIPDYEALNDVLDFAVGGLRPDLTIVLDIPADAAKDRLAALNPAVQPDGPLLERIRAGYLWEAHQRKLPVIYATDDITTVFTQVWKQVASVLTLPGTLPAPPTIPAAAPAAPPTIRAKAAAAEPPKAVSQPAAEPQRPSTDKPSDSSAPVTMPDSAAKTTAAATPPRPTTATPKTTQTLETIEATKPAPGTPAAPAQPLTFGDIATSQTDPIYGFTRELSLSTLSPAFNQLDATGSNLRGLTVRHAGLPLQRKGKQRTDDAAVYSYVIEGASQLLAEQLQNDSATLIAQPGHRCVPEQKDANGHYPYYLPSDLRSKLRSQYIRTMNQLFDTYADMVGRLADHIRGRRIVAVDPAGDRATIAARAALRPLLPLATTGTIAIQGPLRTIRRQAAQLQNSALSELLRTGEQLQVLTHPGMERRPADTPPAGADPLQQMADELLPAQHTVHSAALNLSHYSPRNELDLVADMLYARSDLPKGVLRSEISTWPYLRKLDTFTAYLGYDMRRPLAGSALQPARYEFDLVTSYRSFRGFLEQPKTTAVRQLVSPRLGYDTPALVEEAGLADTYDDCFDLSLQLYSALQEAGHREAAQYATLGGHKVRWQYLLGPSQIPQLYRATTDEPIERQVVDQLREKIAEVHPLLGETMQFIAERSRTVQGAPDSAVASGSTATAGP